MDNEEYEVESVTQARVHDKKGKKITWRYYVKWKGYDWDESTWEPTESFQGGSEHILESFWQRIDTDGRDISDASAFKKGEELFISGPPRKKGPKRKTNGSKTQTSPVSKDDTGRNPSISAPLLTPRKRRRMQLTSDEEDDIEEPKPKRKERIVIAPPRPNRRVSLGQKNGASAKAPKRRRASSPGPRRRASKRQPSAGDSQLDADGETDPDVVEVEDELMLVSGEDMEDDTASREVPVTTSARAKSRKDIVFDDLEHFYNGNPIDIDQTADAVGESVQAQKLAIRPQPQSPPSASPVQEYRTPEPEVPNSPARVSPDPLFDSPSRFAEQTQENQKEFPLPFHRARAANPLVKLIDAPATENKVTHSRITAKARLMSIPQPSTSGSSQLIIKRGGKPGPGRSSSGMITKNRSSLLTATRGVLKSVKGKFTAANTERDRPDEIEEVPTAWGDQGTIGDIEQVEASPNPQSSSAPTGEQLLALAGLKNNAEELPDYEDEDVPVTRESADEGPQELSMTTPGKDKLPEESSSDVAAVPQAGDQIMQSAPSVADPESQASKTVVADASVSSVVTHPAEEVVKKNIELAKEQLFPSAHTSSNTFSDMSGSFKSTIFGPLYQGVAVNHSPVVDDGPSSTFRLICNDTIQLPLVLKDRKELKVRISDLSIGKSAKSSSGRVALFYGAEDAVAIVHTLKSGGTARVVLDSSAEITQKEHFTTLLQRFESSHTLVAPVGTEVCVLYMSDNTSVAEKLGAPAHLMGLSRTLLISQAAIENQLAYVAAVMKASPL